MELTIEMGRGYVTTESRDDGSHSIGDIPIDAIFSPIKKVNYNVTAARVGRRTDYEKLTIEVWTNGTIIPEDAVAYSAKIIKDQMTVFVNFDEEEIDSIPIIEDESDEIIGSEDVLFTRVEELDFSARSLNCLEKANIKYLGDLIQLNEEDLLNLENFGKRSLNEVRDVVSSFNLKLGEEINKDLYYEQRKAKEDVGNGDITEEV
jgi:DNA-directed RNA polymerase subunit alpha